VISGSFEKNSLDWQVQQVQQRLGEWLEHLLFQGNLPLPNSWFLPDWLLKTLFWLIVGLLLLWLGWQLYRLLRPYLDPRALYQPGCDRRAENPSAKDLTSTQWVQRSRTFAQQRNYREACRALYRAAIQRLHDTQLIPDQQSRTDGEYLQLLPTLPQVSPYQLLIQTHERLYFGNAEISAELCDRCQQAYQQVENSLNRDYGNVS
jgi:hypothetical protein